MNKQVLQSDIDTAAIRELCRIQAAPNGTATLSWSISVWGKFQMFSTLSMFKCDMNSSAVNMSGKAFIGAPKKATATKWDNSQWESLTGVGAQFRIGTRAAL